MSGQKISQFPPASSAQAEDELVANQSGTTRKLTVAQLRAGLAPSAHTHAVSDVLGQIPPARLDQAGALIGQVLKWNGSAWAPAADETGGAGTVAWSGLTGIPAAIAAIDNLTPAADRIAFYTGAATAALAPLTSFARSLLDDTDAAQARSTIGAAPETHSHAAGEIIDFAAATRSQAEAMLVAGANISITYVGSGATRQATIAVAGSSASYTAVTNGRTLAAADNGRVLEGGATDVTLTLPAGLGKGFSCLLRRVGTGNLTATAGPGVTFVPAAGPVATTAQWDEIAIECVADSGTAATYLVRRIAA